METRLQDAPSSGLGLPFGEPSRGSEEFAGIFREGALRYLLPLTSCFVTTYFVLMYFSGAVISPLAYGLAALCGTCLALSRQSDANKQLLALRLFLFGCLTLIVWLNYPSLLRPNGFATGGVYLFCLFPVTWWMCFAERRSRLVMLAFCVVGLCVIAAAGQYEGAVARVPNIVLAMSLVRSLFILAILMATCHAMEIALNRFDLRWRNSYDRQAELAGELSERARALKLKDEAHRETLKHLSRSETQLRYLFDNAFDGIVIFDGATGRPRSINPALCRRLGYGCDELTGLSPLEVSPEYQPDGRTSVEARETLLARLAEGGIQSYPWTHLAKSGEHVEYEVTTMTMPGDANTRISVFRDFTSLNNSRRRLQEANAELKSFAGAASHDLKEPLRTMGGFASILSRRYGDTLDEAGRGYLEFITDAAKRGTRLVSDLLTYAEAGAGDIELVEVDLRVAAETVRQNVLGRLETEGGQLTIGPLPKVMATPTWAQQLLQNLVSNALKFARPGVPPAVEVSCVTTALGHELRVRDNGIGIAPEHADRVFGVFERLEGREDYEGSGLGLSLCQRIVRRLGGDIRAEQHEGPGTTFAIWLPPLDGAVPDTLGSAVSRTAVT